MKMTADQLLALLAESKRHHYHCDDSWYCCGMCMHPDHSDGVSHGLSDHRDRRVGECQCGAEDWNAKVDAALAESG